jgi:preprotein translocase subunit SecE
MNKIKTLLQEYSDELLYKVQWPALPDLQNSTITVLVASLLIAIVIFVVDIGFSTVLNFLYGIF